MHRKLVENLGLIPDIVFIEDCNAINEITKHFYEHLGYAMTHFPDPVPIPEEVFSARRERCTELVYSAQIGILIRGAVIIAELVGVYYFGSSAILMDALTSLVDVAATILLIVFIWLAERPPDKEHPFGHGRYEPLMGLQLGLFLVLIGGGMVLKFLFQLSNSPVDNTVMSPYAWIIPFCAVILLEFCYHFVMHTAKKQNSPALAADAVHYRVDSLTSFFAALVLIIGAYIPAWSIIFDRMGAILIAVMMVFLGINAARKNLYQLIDRVPSSEFFDRVKDAAAKVAGVFDTEKILIQMYGPDAHVNVDVEVDPKLSVEEAHKISQNVRAEIQRDWPAVRDVTVHIEPYYPGDH